MLDESNAHARGPAMAILPYKCLITDYVPVCQWAHFRKRVHFFPSVGTGTVFLSQLWKWSGDSISIGAASQRCHSFLNHPMIVLSG
jgi:hypothetical protein